MKNNVKSNSEKTWDIIANSFDKTRKKTWNFVIEYINFVKKDDITADFGCGNGRHLIPLAKKSKESYGIDFSNNLLEIVKNKLNKNKIKNVKLIKSDLTKIPLDSNYFDSILFIAALHNIRYRHNRIKALKEVKRLLKKDKTSLISVWSREQEKFREYFKNKNNNSKELGDIEIYWKQDRINIPRFYHLYEKEEFIQDLEESGLVIVEIKDIKIISKKYPDNYYAIVKN